jgi:hypothetical protein
MPTKPVLPITELDFFQVKSQLKDFLRNDPQGRFQDIDFEGANMSVLLDVLSYNTYQNNFYTNMAISEMFLDTAQLENSVVSHAKELNYLPRSAKSAKAIVDVSFPIPQNNTDASFRILEGTRFTTRSSNRVLNFYTNQDYLAIRESGLFVARNVEIFEGELVEEGFFLRENKTSIRLINRNIDTESIRVFENFDSPFERVEYRYQKDIFGVRPDDAIFYLEPGFDSSYEIVFGNNRFGRVPSENVPIKVIYRISNGDVANGANVFTAAISNTTNQSVNNIVLTTRSVVPAEGGAFKETIDDTRFFAPRSIQVQERAVTERDYEVLLKQRFNEIRDISVFGGEELDPPRFGKVAITVNLDGALSEVSKRKYNDFLRDKTPVGIQPIIIDPEFMFVDLLVNVSFSSKQSRATDDEITYLVRESLKEYNQTRLNKFGASFEVSRVSAIIDTLNEGILNNTINATPYILYSPEFKRSRNPTFAFGTSLREATRFIRSATSTSSTISSSVFTFDDTNVIIEDDGLGRINVLDARERALGRIEIIRRNAGTVDYDTGTVKLSDFIVDSYLGRGIKIFANTQDKNVKAPKNRVLILNDSDVIVNIRKVVDV